MNEPKMILSAGPKGLAICAAAISLAAGDPAQAKARYDAAYCVRDESGLRTFAGRERADDKLLFGISIWYANGQNMTVYGLASKRGTHSWVFRSDRPGRFPDHCQVNISLRPDGTPHLTGDPAAKCEEWGGYGTEIGDITFSRREFKGRVHGALADQEAFFNARLCEP